MEEKETTRFGKRTCSAIARDVSEPTPSIMCPQSIPVSQGGWVPNPEAREFVMSQDEGVLGPLPQRIQKVRSMVTTDITTGVYHTTGNMQVTGPASLKMAQLLRGMIKLDGVEMISTVDLSLIHISEPTRLLSISYA